VPVFIGEIVTSLYAAESVIWAIRAYCQVGSSQDLWSVHYPNMRSYVRRAEAGSEPANPPPGSDGQNRPNLPTGSDLPRVAHLAAELALEGQDSGAWGPSSLCEPFREVIEKSLEHGLSYQRICRICDRITTLKVATTASSDLPGV